MASRPRPPGSSGVATPPGRAQRYPKEGIKAAVRAYAHEQYPVIFRRAPALPKAPSRVEERAAKIYVMFDRVLRDMAAFHEAHRFQITPGDVLADDLVHLFAALDPNDIAHVHHCVGQAMNYALRSGDRASIVWRHLQLGVTRPADLAIATVAFDCFPDLPRSPPGGFTVAEVLRRETKAVGLACGRVKVRPPDLLAK